MIDPMEEYHRLGRSDLLVWAMAYILAGLMGMGMILWWHFG